MRSTADVQPVFRALADPTRRAIIAMLAAGERPVSEIAAAFKTTRPAVAKHLAVLRNSKLISVEKRGRERINRLNARPLRTAAEWINHFDMFWDDRLAALKAAVEQKDEHT